MLAATAVALALAAPAMAQQQNQTGETNRSARPEAIDERPMNSVTLVDVDTVQGAAVNNLQGERIGEVEDVVVDIKRGQISYAIIGVGGFLGIGEKSVAVPWNMVQPGQESQTFVLNAPRRTLETAPAVQGDNIAALEAQPLRDRITAFWDEARSQQAQTPER
ncbi:PRC-barrel domain-containing protein [Magnetospirillum sp. UT-4]|uniref:PRC-barrel domain-containing protein n=1 Tax=Magnetospirillum sp. UT-4 TaxID=2681467 RepID=UPI0015724E9D|nr:PRC-barrel domain-containing protein [Magnetospirillum sp. UT-4]